MHVSISVLSLLFLILFVSYCLWHVLGLELSSFLLCCIRSHPFTIQSDSHYFLWSYHHQSNSLGTRSLGRSLSHPFAVFFFRVSLSLLGLCSLFALVITLLLLPCSSSLFLLPPVWQTLVPSPSASAVALFSPSVPYSFPLHLLLLSVNCLASVPWFEYLLTPFSC